ncbi:MAG: gliding motility-associated C-terminal domain-containing protein [Saprospirales bacterium]|nr:gliding motility-associated C-terminal domain-containing protein [Saprospirales bacterium]
MKNKLFPTCLFPVLIAALFAGRLSAQSAPQAVDDTLYIFQLDPVTYYVLENDTLSDGSHEIFLVEGPLTGAADLDTDGLLTYYPPEFDCSKPFIENMSYGVCNALGCDTARILVKGLCEGIRVYNGFSPNEDGVNDFFRIDGLHRYGAHKIWVFNRWGEVVFYSTEYKNDWDGAWRNHPLPEGTYYYLIEYGPEEHRTGYLQLER